MPRTPAVAVSLLSLVLLAVAAACGDGGSGQASPTPGGTPAATPAGQGNDMSASIDVRDFDTAHLTMSQTTTTNGDVATVAGEGVIDNRRQALSVTLQGGQNPETIAVGPKIYAYNDNEQRWVSYTEPSGGQVGFGRPYWPQFWQDAIQIQNLGGQSLPTAETTHYLLTYDLAKVTQWLAAGASSGSEAVDVTQAEVEVWVDESSRYAVKLVFRLELTYASGTTKIENHVQLLRFRVACADRGPRGGDGHAGGAVIGHCRRN